MGTPNAAIAEEERQTETLARHRGRLSLLLFFSLLFVSAPPLPVASCVKCCQIHMIKGSSTGSKALRLGRGRSNYCNERRNGERRKGSIARSAGAAQGHSSDHRGGGRTRFRLLLREGHRPSVRAGDQVVLTRFDSRRLARSAVDTEGPSILQAGVFWPRV